MQQTPEGQTLPQLPQLFGLVSVSTHVPAGLVPQHVSSGPTHGPPVPPHSHVPLRHVLLSSVQSSFSQQLLPTEQLPLQQMPGPGTEHGVPSGAMPETTHWLLMQNWASHSMGGQSPLLQHSLHVPLQQFGKSGSVQSLSLQHVLQAPLQHDSPLSQSPSLQHSWQTPLQSINGSGHTHVLLPTGPWHSP